MERGNNSLLKVNFPQNSSKILGQYFHYILSLKIVKYMFFMYFISGNIFKLSISDIR